MNPIMFLEALIWVGKFSKNMLKYSARCLGLDLGWQRMCWEGVTTILLWPAATTCHNQLIWQSIPLAFCISKAYTFSIVSTQWELAWRLWVDWVIHGKYHWLRNLAPVIHKPAILEFWNWSSRIQIYFGDKKGIAGICRMALRITNHN